MRRCPTGACASRNGGVIKLVAVCSAIVLVASVAPAGATETAPATLGAQADGSIRLPTNQHLRPAGRQVRFDGRAAAVAARPDGATAAVIGSMGAPVRIVDLVRKTVIDEAPASVHGGSSRGVAYSPGGLRLYVSYVDGRVVRYVVRRDGRLGESTTLTLPSWNRRREIPTGLAVSPYGGRLYVALNRSNRLGVVDTATMRLLSTVDVGNAPNDVAIVDGTVVVTNGGGRRALPGDRTNFSGDPATFEGGTPIVSNSDSGGATTGTATLVDRASLRVRAHVRTGLHPSGIATRGRYAFVANANSDTVTVIDVTAAKAVSTISVRPFPGAPFGSSANDVATFGPSRLLVTLGASNALAVYRWTSPIEPAQFEGMLPTAWHPTNVTVDRRYGRVLVTNNKGEGPATVHSTADPTMIASFQQRASLSVLAMPSATALAAGAQTVARNNAWDAASAPPQPPRDVAPTAIPERLGEPSLIEHVFYVIKENRTYDQILADDPRGNGDPRYLHFGAAVTPNQHALARRFPLFDNFYVAGTRSPDAHQWATQAFVTDYNERWHPSRPRSYPFDGGDALVYAPTPFLWENATRHGKSVRVYGEYANRVDETGTRSDIPSLDRVLSRPYPPFDLSVRDTERVRIILDDLDRDVAAGTVPNLTIVQLPLDHTHGTAPGAPTPEFDVADNDVALGLLIERLSRSPIWSKTAVFVFEDDAQNGLDHVSGQRTTAFVASPYVRRGMVDSTFYTQLNLIRTIEQILGLPPMNQMDLAATPMTAPFTDKPDLAPFSAEQPDVASDVNPSMTQLSGVARAWATASTQMDFGIPDAAPEHLLNRAIWHSVKGFRVPYPGDRRVLWPHEVPSPEGAD